MNERRQTLSSSQRGVVLISSLLLLLVVTIMALSMFRSFGMQERIAGNVREKQRALQVANSTQEYAEWWLANQSNAQFDLSQGNPMAADVACAAAPVLDANTNVGQICSNTLIQLLASSGVAATSAAAWPSVTAPIGGVLYTPPTMNVTSPALPNYYYARPRFYIADQGLLATGRGEIYQIDAYAYGLTATALALVESTVAITCTVCNPGAL